MDYYVYIHRRKSDNSIFYVGKGCRKRAWSKDRSAHWKRIYHKHGVIVEIVQNGLQEWYAFELEQSLILKYGRLSDGTGLLVNHFEGGTQAGRPVCKNINQKISEALKGKAKSPEHIANLKLAMLLYIERNGPIKRGKLNEESKLKISRSKIGKKTEGDNHFAKPIICIETGEVFRSLKSAEKWMRSIGYEKASANSIGRVLRGIHKQYHGYSWKYLTE